MLFCIKVTFGNVLYIKIEFGAVFIKVKLGAVLYIKIEFGTLMY